jgi:hypothetical protein
VADWILNFTKGGAKVKKQLPQQAREPLDIGLWGIPTTAQAKDKLAAGDRVLVYIGAPERVFIGHARIKAPWHEWSSSESESYPMNSTFAAGIALTDAEVWSKPVPLATVWPHTEGAKTNPGALWYGAAVRVAQNDFEAIVQVGQTAVSGQPLTTSSPNATGHEAAAKKPAATSSPGLRAALVSPANGLPESEALFKAARRLRAFLADPKPLNEASTRAFFLDRIFDALGYTEFEDIDHGSVVQSGDFPDYVLRAAGNAVVAIEAKRIGHPLGPKEAGQLVKYCSVLGLRWGVLTDGRFLQIYDAPVTGVLPEDRLVLEVDLNDWADREDFDLRRWPEAAMLTKAAMQTGDALERYAARELIRDVLTDSSSQTLKTLRKELQSKKVLLGEPAIASLINELLT